MQIDWNLVKEIIIVVVSLVIGGFVKQWFERKPRVVYFVSHASSFRLKDIERDEDLWSNTHSIILRNTGRRTAKNVRISHRDQSIQFNIFPSIRYEVSNLPDGGAEIVIGQLVPKEVIEISYLYFPPLTYLNVMGEIKHDEGFAQLQPVLFQRQFPKALNIIVGILTLLGAITLIYFVITGFLGLFA